MLGYLIYFLMRYTCEVLLCHMFWFALYCVAIPQYMEGCKTDTFLYGLVDAAVFAILCLATKFPLDW